jgi:hypothetical protein
MTTPMVERDQLAVAPEMEHAFRQEVERRGSERTSVSDRVSAQLSQSLEV